jgi:hypothetical protein
MGLALDILCGGFVLVALVLAVRVPREKIPELARALARWFGHPGASSPMALPGPDDANKDATDCVPPARPIRRARKPRRSLRR